MCTLILRDVCPHQAYVEYPSVLSRKRCVRETVSNLSRSFPSDPYRAQSHLMSKIREQKRTENEQTTPTENEQIRTWEKHCPQTPTQPQIRNNCTTIIQEDIVGGLQTTTLVISCGSVSMLMTFLQYGLWNARQMVSGCGQTLPEQLNTPADTVTQEDRLRKTLSLNEYVPPEGCATGVVLVLIPAVQSCQALLVLEVAWGIVSHVSCGGRFLRNGA